MTGGKNNENQAVGTVTRFHPRTKSVHQMANLGTLRFGHGLVVLNASLYAVGGYGDDGGRVKVRTIQLTPPYLHHICAPYAA